MAEGEPNEINRLKQQFINSRSEKQFEMYINCVKQLENQKIFSLQAIDNERKKFQKYQVTLDNHYNTQMNYNWKQITLLGNQLKDCRNKWENCKEELQRVNDEIKNIMAHGGKKTKRGYGGKSPKRRTKKRKSRKKRKRKTRRR